MMGRKKYTGREENEKKKKQTEKLESFWMTCNILLTLRVINIAGDVNSIKIIDIL